jgi:Spy/CpxP family protein refolding chaperone
MTSITKKFLGVSALALSLAISVPALAEAPANAPPSMPMGGQGMMMGPNGNGPMGGEFREDMEKMHKEQASLDEAREKLWEKCVPATKEQVASCKTEREALHQRSVKLMEERKAMHEKMEKMRKERHEQMEERREGQPEHKMMPPGAQAPVK